MVMNVVPSLANLAIKKIEPADIPKGSANKYYVPYKQELHKFIEEGFKFELYFARKRLKPSRVLAINHNPLKKDIDDLLEEYIDPDDLLDEVPAADKVFNEEIDEVFDEAFDFAYQHEYVPQITKLRTVGNFLEARKRIEDLDLITVANRIEGPLSVQLRLILQNENISINVKADQLRACFNNIDNIAKVSQIQSLNLRALNLNTIPKELNLLTGLVELNLSVNRIREFPPNFLKDAPNLQSLYLDYNQFTELPPNFLNTAPNLQKLYLNNNKIRKLPNDFLKNAPNLQKLDLNNNKIRKLPNDFLKNAPNLQKLVLKNNKIKKLPDDFLKNAPNLRKLVLKNNFLRHLPADFLKNAPNLQKLDLFMNYLKDLPDDFLMNSPNLQEFYLWRNNIELYQDEMYKHPNEIVREQYKIYFF